ncbi:hypothetical protein [uncultured Tolumonas sp.]|uniref:hypothetical protein n=1 Tax=uncultured Tolumonas sp. TaxID=263765 RepID=UPI00292CCD41|nr:hypothetical protein [uncultured Tolumonas sp.]
MKISLFFLLLNFIILIIDKFSNLQFSYLYFVVLLGMLLAFFMELFIRLCAHNRLKSENTDTASPTKKSYFWLLLSPGFYYSSYFKSKINSTYKIKELRTALVKNINHYNLTFSAGFFTLLSVIDFLGHDKLGIISFKVFVLGFCSIRNTSRCIEIIYAFVNDVFDNNQISTTLNKFDRAKLALNSYMENIFNFASLYYAIEISNRSFPSLLSSIGRSTISNIGTAKELTFIAIYAQIITSLVLVVLSLTIYISREK